MNKFNKGYTLIELIYLVVIVIGFIGWIWNIVKIVQAEEVTGFVLLRLIGTVVAPLGAVLGFL